MLIGKEAIVFGAGPAGLVTGEKLVELGCQVTMIDEEGALSPRSVYTTSIDTPGFDSLSPQIRRDLESIRLLTQRGTDFRVNTGNAYFMLDYPSYVNGGREKLARQPGLRMEFLPTRQINDIRVEEVGGGIMVFIDREIRRFDFAFDCTGIGADILRQVDPARKQENFLAEYVYGAILPGSLEKDELILVFGPAGGTSWVCPSIINPDCLDIAFSAWGSYQDYSKRFLPTAEERLWTLIDFLKGKKGIDFQNFRPQEKFAGMIRSQPSPRPKTNYVYGLGESVGMGKPFSGDTMRRTIQAKEMLGISISNGESPKEFYKRWRRHWSQDRFFWSLALARLSDQKKGLLGLVADRCGQLLATKKVDENHMKMTEDWIIRHKLSLPLLGLFLTEPKFRNCFLGVLLKQMETLARSDYQAMLAWSLPDTSE